jgi:phosphohistidine swiveling domain-containing protein
VSHLLSLDEPAARDPALTGVKAARLAQARAGGLPVLPGRVVPVDASRAAMRVGAETLGRSASAAAACLAVSGVGLDQGVRRDLLSAGREIERSTIVRSSTSVDGDPRWAGAFSTYLDVADADLLTAVTGCWASTFTRDAVERSEAIGVRPWDGGMGVLVQPYVAFDLGGTAEVDPDGTVRITAASGGPAGIVGGGRSGVVVELPSDNSHDDPALRDVATLVRSVRRATGFDAIEWGAVSDDVFVLQVSSRVPVATSAPRVPALVEAPPSALRLAAAAARFPGALGEALILPWAAATHRIPDPPHLTIDDAATAVGEAKGLARALTQRAWGDADVTSEPASTFRLVLGRHPQEGFEALARLRPVDVGDAARLVGLIEATGRRLVADGRLPHPGSIWRCVPEGLETAIASEAPLPVRGGPDRWEPFVFGVVAGAGDVRTGTSAAPGVGAGRPALVRGPDDARPGPRRVLVLRRPTPQVSPLLWECAGVVCAGGSVGAHLFEVARSCGVPAIVGVDLSELDAASLVAVDGDAGRVTTWSPSSEERAWKGA